MSWSASAVVVAKKDVKRALDALELTGVNSIWAVDQFEEAKDAALTLTKGIPGPYIIVNMSGHANGIGYQKKEGWANDFVSISVGQVTAEEYERYHKDKK